MKTTVDIPDPLLEQAHSLAAAEKTTLKALMAEGLRKVIADRANKPPFKLEDRSFRGEGLQPGIEKLSWAEIREMSYSDRES